LTSRRSLVLVLALAFLVRVPFLTTDFGRTSDMKTFRQWSRGIQYRGLGAAYQDPTVDYPPLSVLLFAFSGALEASVPVAWCGGDRFLNAMIKLPPLLADIAAGWLVALHFRRRGRRHAALAAAAYTLNPAVWYVSAYWGQYEAVYTLFLVGSVLALEARSPAAAWLSGVLAFAVKPQAVVLAPLLLVWTAAREGVRGLAKGAASALFGVLVLVSPWLVTGRAGDLARTIGAWPEPTPHVDVSAYNLWYLVLGGRVAGVRSDLTLPGLGLTYRAFALLAVGLFALVVVALALRARLGPALAAACLALGLYVLATEIHERFMFPALALLLVAAAEIPALLAPYAVLSATFAYNLVTIAPFASWLGINLIVAPDSPRTSWLRGLAIAAAALNVAALASLTAVLAWSRRQRAASR